VSVRSSTPAGSRKGPSTVSRYDLLLAALPASLLSGTAVGSLSALPLHVGTALGAVPSLLLLCYGLFHDAPRP
jgi:hypothetical protein